jgi:hypothetical protein
VASKNKERMLDRKQAGAASRGQGGATLRARQLAIIHAWHRMMHAGEWSRPHRVVYPSNPKVDE